MNFYCCRYEAHAIPNKVRDGPHSLYKYWTKISGSSMMSQSAQERNDEKTKTKSFT